MKKYILFLLLLSACSGSTNDEAETPLTPKYTLVFMDKTQSVNPQEAYVKSKYTNTLKNLVEESIEGEGDALEVYFLHENTTKAKAMSVRSRTERQDLRGLSPTDQEAAKNAFQMNISQERSLIFNALMAKLMESNVTSSNNETHVSGGVPVMAAALENHPKITAWFFSDMVESRKSGRDFHTRPPKSLEEANTWAREDAASYANANLSGAEVHMVLPFSPNSSSRENNPLVTAYWKTYFNTLGVGKLTEH